MENTTSPAGWYPNPTDTAGPDRWWDGEQWTDRLATGVLPATPPPLSAHDGFPPPPPSTAGSGDFGRLLADIFQFRRFVVPQLVKLVFVLGILAITVACYQAVGSGGHRVYDNYGDVSISGGTSAGVAIVAWIFAVIWLRVVCELIIVAFRVERNTRGLRDRDQGPVV